MSTTYKNPPINEVVVSLYFNTPLVGLRSEHIGLFWTKIKGDFPTAKQQLPVNMRDEIIQGEIFPMPRYWFIANDEINVIQLQKNAFMLNWRRRQNNEYPGYFENIKPTYDKYYELFSEFIRAEFGIEELTIDLCELVYINTIERSDFWTVPLDTEKVIPSFTVPNAGVRHSEATDFNCHYAYKVSKDLQLNISLRTGVRTQQQNAPVLAFEIKAVGSLGGKTKLRADEWFHRAHDTINKCFANMTSQDVQKKQWIPLEDTP